MIAFLARLATDEHWILTQFIPYPPKPTYYGPLIRLSLNSTKTTRRLDAVSHFQTVFSRYVLQAYWAVGLSHVWGTSKEEEKFEEARLQV